MHFKHSPNRIWLENEQNTTVAWVEFPAVADGVVDVQHTVVDESLKGQGIAGKLMQELVSQLREDGRKAVLTCSYAVAWFDKRPDCADVLCEKEARP